MAKLNCGLRDILGDAGAQAVDAMLATEEQVRTAGEENHCDLFRSGILAFRGRWSCRPTLG